MPGGRPGGNSSLTPEKKAEFLAALSDCGNVTHAARAIGIDRTYIYQRRNDDESFAREWERAAKVGAARLEDEARARAVEGWEEPVWHKGEMVGTVRKYSDVLLICLLKAHHPEKYRDNVRQEISGPDGGPIRVEDALAAGRTRAAKRGKPTS